jgi:hypothetical protein
VAYFRNGLGNLIQMTPALQALASMEAEGKVDVCLDSEWDDVRRPAVDALLGAMPFVGRVVNFPAEKINQNSYRRWFYTPHSEPSQAYHLFESAGKRAISRIGWDRLFMREVDYYMEAARRFGFTGTMPPLYCPVGQAPELDAPRPWVGLCNGSFGTMAAVKRWPHFAALARVLRLYTGGTVICVGSRDELPVISQAVDYAGQLSIVDTAAVLKRLDVFITVDTCLMHCADALGIPSITLWGGTLVSKNGPTSPRAAVLRAGIECQPCQYTPRFLQCKAEHCLRALSVGEVMRSVRDFL